MSRICTTLLLIMLVGTPLCAQQLTLEQALQSANATSIASRNAKLTLEKQLNQATINSFLPSISLTAGATASASLLEQNSSARISPTADLSFSLSSVDRFTKASNELLAKTAQTTYNSSIQSLRMQVTRAYWNVTAAQLSYAQQKTVWEQAQASFEAMQAKYEGGRASSLAVSQAKLAFSQASITLESRKNDYENAKQTLQALVGYEFDETSDELMDIQSLKPLADLQDLVLATSSLQLLSYKIEQAEVSLKKTHATTASPTVAFSASTSLASSLSTTGSSYIRDTTQIGVSVSLSLDPYLQNSSSQVTLENLQKDITLAENELQQGIKTARTEVKNLYQNLTQLEAQLQYLFEYQAASEVTVAYSQAAYEAGEITYQDLKDSEQQLQNARLSILQQKVNYTLSLYELAYLLETDVTTIITEEGNRA